MRIFFVHSGNETFVKLDREILSGFAEVRDLYASKKFPLRFLDYWQGVKNTDLVFCWFASWNSFWALLLAKLMRKPSILVFGGYDIANLPESDYGSQRGGIGKVVSQLGMQLADRLLSFSDFSQQEAKRFNNIPNNRIQRVYLGVPDPFGKISTGQRERMALTVGNVEQANLKRKGLEPFVLAAAHLPDVKFYVVGSWADSSIEYLRKIASNNVVFTGRVTDEELHHYYQQASVYVQASLHEGFGLSVAEAMLAGCIPVVTTNGSLPEVVGESGIYCSSSAHDMADKINLALESDFAMREFCRKRILNLFPMRNRAQAIEQMVRDALLN